MNIKTKLFLGVGVLTGMIVLLVGVSTVNLQVLTATDPDSPVALPALHNALVWVYVAGGVSIACGIGFLVWLPRSIDRPVKKLTEGIMEIAGHNYSKHLDFGRNQEFSPVAESFNRMADRLAEYRASSLSDILSAKKYIEAIVNSIGEPIICLNKTGEIAFINDSPFLC